MDKRAMPDGSKTDPTVDKTELEWRRRNRILSVLHETALGIMNRRNVVELLETALEQAVELTAAAAGWIVLFNEERSEQIRVVALGNGKRLLGNRQPITADGAGRVWETGEMVVINPPCTPPEGSEPTAVAGAFIGVPLRNGPNLAGVICLQHRQTDRRFTEEDEEALEQLAGLASVAYENAVLHRDLEKELSDRRLMESVQATLYEISETAHCGAMEKLFDALYQLICRLIPTNNVVIAFYDATTDTVTFPYFVGSRAAKPQTRCGGRGLTEYVVRQGERVLLSTADYWRLLQEGEIRVYDSCLTESVAKDGMAWLGIPLRDSDNQIFGVLSVDIYDSNRQYTEADIDMLNFVSRQVAMAIERARVQAALRESEEKYRTIVENSADAIFIVRDEKYHFINKTMGGLFGLEQSEMEGKPITLFLHPDYQKQVVENYRLRLQGKEVPDSYEIKIINQQGEVRSGDVASRRILLNGEPVILGIGRDTTLEKRAAQTQQALYRISEAAGTAENMKELYRDVHSIIRELLPAENFFIALYNEQEDTLTFPYYVDVNFDAELSSLPSPRPVGRSLTDQVIRTGELLCLTEDEICERQQREEIKCLGTLCRHWLGVPLKGTDDRILGAMVVQIYEGRNRYTQADREIMTTVSRQVAMAVERTRVKNALRESEEKYRVIAENTLDAIFVIKNGKYIWANEAMGRMLGIDSRELIGQKIGRFVHPDRQPWFYQNYQRKTLGELNQEFYEIRVVTAQGQDRLWEMNTRPILVGGEPAVQGLGRDVTDRIRAGKVQNALYQIAEATSSTANLATLYRAVHQIVSDLIPAENFYIALYDRSEQCLLFPYFVDQQSTSPPVKRPIRRGITEYVINQRRPVCLNHQELLALYERREVTAGKKNAMYWLGVPLKDVDGQVFGVMTVQSYEGNYQYTKRDIDILEAVSGQVALAIQRKQAEEKLRYFSLHDALTGLFNRAYFETELQRINDGRNGGVAIIVCDVDGLKLMNDTMGHVAGDRVLTGVAGILRKSVRQEDVVARIGGDEFAVLLREGDAVGEVCRRIRQEIRNFNRRQKMPVSLSVGHSFRETRPFDSREVFREADNHMYREKLHRSRSIRSSLVQTAMKMLEMRDFLTEGHGERLQDMVTRVARRLQMQERQIADLRLLARFHDIGKVGIPDRILFKPGPLTPEETKEMQCHCEIGHRIALSSEDITPLADWILKHQEWWDGRGYPLGIRGDDIPLECRILALADAYDAMTSDRPYRKAVSREEAIVELRQYAGTQFDPTLVEIFIEVI
ncbi:MAG TPA: GAF domain-containing protein [Patescibacteria group bacterium]|nr:GAF domain-containing protein [Patescibacteria group bacterium]